MIALFSQIASLIDLQQIEYLIFVQFMTDGILLSIHFYQVKSTL